MKIVKQSFELLYPAHGMDAMFELRKIERAGRTCYKSEPKSIDPTPFVERLIRKGHLSVLEHGTATAVIICDRGISHQIVRHRLCSYSQECVAGSTFVRKDKTIKQLFDRSSNMYGKTHNKTISLRSCDMDNAIFPNRFSAVFYKGKGEVYRLRTSFGYEILATMDHEFKSRSGIFVKMRDLASGDAVMVNGRPRLMKIEDSVLRNDYLELGLSPVEIAARYEIGYRTVLNNLHRLGILSSHLNDKNKEKYNSGRTEESVEKMRQVILEQYRHGRTSWNKGLREKDSESVGKQADSLRKNHYNNQPGPNNSNWKGGVSQKYYSSIVPDGPCELCGNEEKTEIHHLDKNSRNNSRDNLIRACLNCHKKLHAGWHVGKIAHADTIVSIDYHGIEDVYDIEMNGPYHNYIANGFVVHNSTRYCNYSKDKFGNEITVIAPQFIDDDSYFTWLDAMNHAEEFYMSLLEDGVPSQLARSVLPQSLKTEIVMSANLRQWLHIFEQRTSKHAHPQIQELMRMGKHEFAKLMPTIFTEDK